MNLWVIVIMVAVMALLLMGKNPMREFQEKQQALMQKYGSDELTAQTNMYLEQQQGKEGGSSIPGIMMPSAPQKKFGGPNASDISKSIKESATIVGNDQEQFQQKGIYVAPASEFDTDEDGDIIIEQQGGSPVPSQAQRPAAKNSTYYPPIVAQDGNDVLDVNKLPRLRSGQPVLIEGSKVYSVDAAGNKSQLPDGEYIMQDGSRFSSRNGRRTTLD